MASMSPSSSSPPPTQNTEKRKRLSLACNVCRRKKIKCDGEKPSCGKCQKFGLECSYASSVKKRGPKQGHIDSIEQRLKKMEELITSQPKGKPATETSIQSLVNEDSLPSKEVSLELFDAFFKHFLMPPIADIQGLRTKVENGTCNHFLLYSILSVGARFSENPDIVKYPLWTSGETFAKKARNMIGKIIDEPTIEHIQGLLVLTINEYGLARESRCWMYSGIAVRMILELGFHKELIYDETPGVVISIERWYWYETRRKLFWGAFFQEKIMSASTGRPQMMSYKDCDLLLPTFDNTLNFNTRDAVEIYQHNLNWTKLIRYSTCKNNRGEVIGVQVIPVEAPSPRQHPLFSKVDLSSHVMELYVILGRIAELINRGYREMNPEVNLEIEQLNQDLSTWESRLQSNQTYTDANLAKYRQESTLESANFFLAHILYNSLIVLLNRGSLVIADMPKLGNTTQQLQDEIARNKNRCLGAANNMTCMLKDFVSKFAVIPPSCIYLVYISATVVVNNSFSMDPEECKIAEQSLNEYYKFFEGMKLYWAASEKMFFLMRDLYAVHKKVISAHDIHFSDGNHSLASSLNVSSENGSIVQNDSLIRRLPLADIAFSSGSSSMMMPGNNTYMNVGYNEQELPQFQSSFQTVRESPIDFYSGSSGFTSFDVWLEQQQENRRLL